MPTPPTVRSWEPPDLESIGRVHSRSRQHAYAELVPAEALARVTPTQQTSVWRKRLADLDPHSGAELNAIHALPEHQGTGAGQVLMNGVIDAFERWKVSEAHLHVIEGNERAQAFYRRNGWRPRGPAGVHEVGGAAVPILEYRRTIG